jgi:hypothetical protein
MPEKQGATPIAVVMTLIDEQEDPREGFAICQDEIARYEQAGDEVPEPLVRVHKALEAELILESRGG